MIAKDYEIENARLLIEQTWTDFKPAYEAMWRFFAACAFRSPTEDHPLPASELVRCDACARPLYRRAKDRWAVITLTRDEGFISRSAVTARINNRIEIVACNFDCLTKAIRAYEETLGTAGYRL